MISLKAHAKINLALEVMDKKDGYHLVNNIMIPIELHDEITIEKDKDIYVVDDNIPDNIMLKAAKLFLSSFNIDGGCKITIKKNIPVSAGLAGGSTDAAAILRGLNELYEVNATNEGLRELASILGSDVPFFIEEECALCTNRGEEIHPLINNLEPLNLYLLKVQSGSSTALVYKNYHYTGVSKKGLLDDIIMGLYDNDKFKVIHNSFNDLTLPALAVNNELNEAYTKLILNGISARVSGSGPTMFVINPRDEELTLINSLLDESVLKIKTKTL